MKKVRPAQTRRPSLEDTPVRQRPSQPMIFPAGWNYFRSWRYFRWYLLLILPPAVGLVAACLRHHVSSGIAMFVMGCATASALFVQINSGMTSSNWGTFFRSREPVRYWLDVALVGTVYVGVSAFGWFIT